MKLEGIDLVWDFSIFSEDEHIRNQCNNFLTDLYLYNVKEDYNKRGRHQLNFLQGLA